MIKSSARFHGLLVSLFLPTLMADPIPVAVISQRPADGKIVFTLNEPVSLSLDTGVGSNFTLGFVLRDVYSPAHGPAVDGFVSASSSESELRTYLPSLNRTSTGGFGTWGSRSNTGGDIDATDFFGAVTLGNPDPLPAGAQVVLLPGQVVLGVSDPAFLPDDLNDATEIAFFNPLVGQVVSAEVGIGAAVVAREQPRLQIEVGETEVVVDWQGPGLLQRAEFGDPSSSWIELDSEAPPRVFQKATLGPRAFFRLRTF